MRQFRSVASTLAVVALALVAATVLSGCKGKDKKSGGGGSNGVIYPQVPVGRPTLVGMPVAIDTSGGDNAGTGDAGSAGNMDIRAANGRVVKDDGRARPVINNNFLTATELGGGEVTYAELIAVAPSQTTLFNNQLFIDIVGQDFFIPAGVTLNLSAAPGSVGQVLIRTHLAGDYIRIDGPVNGVRTTLDSVSLVLLAVDAAGTSISVDGAVDLSGYASTITYDGGNLALFSYGGSVIMGGTVNLRGNAVPSGAAPAGAGGSLQLSAQAGDVVLRPGMLQAAGGNCTNGNFGGDGGNIEIEGRTATLQTVDWGFRTRGGLGAISGGVGGDIFVNIDGPINAFIPFLASSGSTISGATVNAGDVRILGLTVQGAVVGSADGGNGGSGGDAGSISVEGESVFGLALEATANGGIGSAGSGGDGGNVSVYADGAAMVNLLLTLQANGGQGSSSGGQSGACEVSSYAEMRNLDVTLTAVGGAGGTGPGGNGSTGFNASSIQQSSSYGEAITNSTFTVNVSAGNGTTGGSAGNLNVFLGSSNLNDFSLSITGNGGTGTTGAGGAGGNLFVSHGTFASTRLSLTSNLNGGSSQSGDGGLGGGISVTQTRGSFWLSGGPLNAAGGASAGAGTGGEGGRFNYDGQEIETEFVSTNVTCNFNGGSSATGSGGSGGYNVDYAYQVDAGIARINGGSIFAAGGTGNSVNGAGGSGGGVLLQTQIGGLWFDSDLDIRGAGNTGGGAGGSGGNAALFALFGDLVITGDILADSPTATVPGMAGQVNLGGNAASTMTISSLISCNGGTGTAAAGPVGAAGGNINVGGGTERNVRFTATALLRANGGGPAANAGVIDIDIVGTGGTGTILLEDAGSQLITNNGTGTAVPGNIDRNSN